MVVGTILLTKTNKYVDMIGNLPVRPEFDKALLTGLIAGTSLVSEVGYALLPPSIQKTCSPEKQVGSGKPYTPVTIRELAVADLLIVSRSPEDFDDGRVFRLDNFKCLVKDERIEIWMRVN